MKRRAFLSALPVPALAHEEPLRMGLHGMALFGGREGLYASHLPMFHAPHDVQLLLRVRLADATHDARLRAELAARPQLWTLEPERFDLSRLHSTSRTPLRAFGARLVEGHFERGGNERVARAELQIESVLLFNRLLPEKRVQPQQRFFCFGRGHEQFLVKWLDQRPDIDLIGRYLNTQPLTGQRVLTLPSPGLQAPASDVLMNALRQSGARPQAAPQWLYLETGDLA